MRARGLTISDASQAQFQSSEWAHSNIYPVSEMLVCMKGQALQIQNYRMQKELVLPTLHFSFSAALPTPISELQPGIRTLVLL